MHQHTDNIICFKHCIPNTIFCKEIPQKCPICNNILVGLPLEPVIIPYPLTSAGHNECCIVIRPTEGCFLCDYNINDDLHIGVTNSQSNVIEYDKCGLVKDNNEKWKNCIVIPLIPSSWQILWDEILSSMFSDSKWHAANYDEVKFNCFSFVISFLQNVNHQNARFKGKEEMCTLLILPKIQSVLKYAKIYRYLKFKDFYVQD